MCVRGEKGCVCVCVCKSTVGELCESASVHVTSRGALPSAHRAHNNQTYCIPFVEPIVASIK